MNLLELGATLKRERERRGLSVRDVMDATKISRRNISALEAGEVRSLPHPVYLKGYVRNYARLVGLDPEPLVAVVEEQHDGDSRYLPQPAPAPQSAALQEPAPPAAPPAAAATEPQPEPQPVPQPEPVAEPVAPPAAPAAVPAAAPAAAVEEPPLLRLSTPEPLGQPAPKKRSSALAIAALLLLAAVLAGLVYQYQRMQDEPAPAPVAPVAPAPAGNATSPDNATDAAAAVLSGNATLPEAAMAPAQPVLPAATAVLSGEPPRKAPEVPAQSVSGTSIEVSRKASAQAAAPEPAPAAKPAPEVRATGVQTLTITAKPKEVCWVGVYEGDRATTFLLRDGESRQVNFGKKARLRLGNAGGATVRLNGESYPFEGARGEKVTLEFGTR